MLLADKLPHTIPVIQKSFLAVFPYAASVMLHFTTTVTSFLFKLTGHITACRNEQGPFGHVHLNFIRMHVVKYMCESPFLCVWTQSSNWF